MLKVILGLFFVVSLTACGGQQDEIATTSDALVSSDACGVTYAAVKPNYVVTSSACTKHAHWKCADNNGYVGNPAAPPVCLRTQPRDPLPGVWFKTDPAAPTTGPRVYLQHGWGEGSATVANVIPQGYFFPQYPQSPTLLADYGYSYYGANYSPAGMEDSILAYANFSSPYGTVDISLRLCTGYYFDGSCWTLTRATQGLGPAVDLYSYLPPGTLIRSFYTF